ncbi:MAG: hypothetical protein ACRDIE_20915 [Chloroflexota bacterium]
MNMLSLVRLISSLVGLSVAGDGLVGIAHRRRRPRHPHPRPPKK